MYYIHTSIGRHKVRKMETIQRLPPFQLYVWYGGHHHILVKYTLRLCDQFFSTACCDDMENQKESTYTSLIFCGKLWAAVCWIMVRKRGGEYCPRDTCSKIGETVMAVLQANNPEACPLTDARFNRYTVAPLVLVPLDITMNKVAELYGGNGPRGKDIVSLQQ